MATQDINNLKWAKLKGDTAQPVCNYSGLQKHTYKKKKKYLTNLSTTIGEVEAADDGVGHHEWHDIWAGSIGSLHSDGNVCQRHVIIAHTNLSRGRNGTDKKIYLV